MIPSYSFNHLHKFRLFLIISAVWCFNEPCIDDNSCVTDGFQCRFNHCLCPSNQFWAGQTKHCIECPNGWINLFIFCIYYEDEMMTWTNAGDTCRRIGDPIGENVRLLELINLNEFYFIQNSIEQILTDNQMNSLPSATAYIGSQGEKSSNGNIEWIYRWRDQNDKTYTSSSQMWCREKYWNSMLIEAEPSWENSGQTEITFQVLKRWSNSNDACLASLLPNDTRPFLCEIVGESGRLHNQLNLTFLFTTTTTILTRPPSTTRTTPTTSTTSTISTTSSTTTTQTISITDLSLLTITQQLSTLNFTSTISLNLNLTDIESDSKPNHLLFIIIGSIGVIILIIIFIIIMNVQCKKKPSTGDFKSNNTESLSWSKTKKNNGDEMQSNYSSESHLTGESSAHQSDDSPGIFSDHKPSSSTQLNSKTGKRALWDEMESSLFSSTLQDSLTR